MKGIVGASKKTRELLGFNEAEAIMNGVTDEEVKDVVSSACVFNPDMFKAVEDPDFKCAKNNRIKGKHDQPFYRGGRW